MKRKGILVIASCLALVGCGELRFPAGLVTRDAGGVEVAYSGELLGRIDGSSSYVLVSEDGSDTCTGVTSAEATGSFTCTSGRSGAFTFPREVVGRLSAKTTGTTTSGLDYAFGWGREADLARLRPLVP